jgi:hypothetical protein
MERSLKCGCYIQPAAERSPTSNFQRPNLMHSNRHSPAV